MFGFERHLTGPTQSNWLRRAYFVCAVICMASWVLAPQARAQNLISDPYFAIGVPQTGFIDRAGNYFYTEGATSATFDGVTGAVLSGSSTDNSGNPVQGGSIEISPLAGFDTSGINYTFTFFAAALNPDIATTVYGIFGPVAGGLPVSFASLSLTSTTLTKFTITGTSTDSRQNGIGPFLEIQAQNPGTVFVTGLQFESAPAPNMGGGIFSFAMLMAGLAGRTIRQRISTRR